MEANYNCVKWINFCDILKAEIVDSNRKQSGVNISAPYAACLSYDETSELIQC